MATVFEDEISPREGEHSVLGTYDKYLLKGYHGGGGGGGAV